MYFISFYNFSSYFFDNIIDRIYVNILFFSFNFCGSDFFLLWLIVPIIVSYASGQYLLANFTVRPDHELQLLCIIALHQVFLLGIPLSHGGTALLQLCWANRMRLHKMVSLLNPNSEFKVSYYYYQACQLQEITITLIYCLSTHAS